MYKVWEASVKLFGDIKQVERCNCSSLSLLYVLREISGTSSDYGTCFEAVGTLFDFRRFMWV